jgi:hypothetical protein
MSKSTTHFTKPAVNNQKEDDDDEPMTLLDIVKAQKKKG